MADKTQTNFGAEEVATVSKNVQNTSSGDLGLPNGTMVRAGNTVRVDDWNTIESNVVLKAWVESGALVVTDTENNKEDESKKAPAKK